MSLDALLRAYDTFDTSPLPEPHHDETLCDCGHERKHHRIGMHGTRVCCCPYLPTGWLCLCKDFTVTVRIRRRLVTEEDLVEQAAKKGH